MTDHDSKSERVAPRQQVPPFVERRGTVRTLPRDVRGTMNWRGDTGEVACDVAVLDISGGGAALLADRAPAGHSG